MTKTVKPQEINSRVLEVLRTNGFMWVKNKSSDKVPAEHISVVVPAAGGFTVAYVIDPTVVIRYSTAKVTSIEIPEDPNEWIRVNWDSITDEYKNGEIR